MSIVYIFQLYRSNATCLCVLSLDLLANKCVFIFPRPCYNGFWIRGRFIVKSYNQPAVDYHCNRMCTSSFDVFFNDASKKQFCQNVFWKFLVMFAVEFLLGVFAFNCFDFLSCFLASFLIQIVFDSVKFPDICFNSAEATFVEVQKWILGECCIIPNVGRSKISVHYLASPVVPWLLLFN